MTNTNITGGVVSVEDGTKKAEEYAPARKVRVEIHFNVPEGAANGTDDLDLAADIASRKVGQLLGVSYKFTPGTEQAAEATAPKPAGRPRKPPTQEATGPTKAELEARHLASLGATAAEAAAITGEQAKLPAKEPEPNDSLDDLVGDPKPQPKEITDKDLVSATTKKNEVLKSAVKIRELVATFFDADKKGAIREIPQARRQEYLDKLEALA